MALAVRRLPVGASLAFQPVVWLRDLTLAGYEVLLRGVADPAAFFADAVRGGWACELDAEVCRMAAAAVPLLDPEALLFVNLTPQSFLAGRAAREALAGAPRRRVVVEVTEHAFSTAPGELARATAGWRGAGFRLAVDDVGSGQSRLLALAEARPDFVKVDRPLLAQAARGGAPLTVLQHVVAASRALGATVVAEGIETGEELHLARALGIELGQGFLLGRPGPLPAGGPPALGESSREAEEGGRCAVKARRARAASRSSRDPEAPDRLARVIGEIIPGVLLVAEGEGEAEFLVPAERVADFERYAKLAGCVVEWD